jgi:hypothetical protein
LCPANVNAIALYTRNGAAISIGSAFLKHSIAAITKFGKALFRPLAELHFGLRRIDISNPYSDLLAVTQNCECVAVRDPDNRVCDG